MLVHNGLDYVKITLDSLKNTNFHDKYELICLDNASNLETTDYLYMQKKAGVIDKLIFENENTFFAKGNNLAAGFCSDESEYILLLNSDIEIKNPNWLSKLVESLENGSYGAASFGQCITEKGVIFSDGFCFLVKKSLYLKFMLNENYQWWYSIAELQKNILKENNKILVIKDFEEYLHHFGGGSGDAWKKAKGMDLDISRYDKWLDKYEKQIKHIYSFTKNIGNSLDNCNILRGISCDKWCTSIVDFEVNTSHKKSVIIKGWAPQKDYLKKIKVFINRKYFKVMEYNEESFVLTIPISNSKEVNRITLEMLGSFKADKPDIRDLCFVINELSVE